MLTFGFRCAANGCCEHIDPGWSRIIAGADYLGMTWLDYVHPDEQRGVAETFATAVRTQVATTYVCRVKGEYDYIRTRVVVCPLLDSDGCVIGFVGTLQVARADVPELTRSGTD